MSVANDSKFRLLRTKRGLNFYRNLVLLNRLQNQAYSSIFTPIILFSLECLIQVGAYCVIRLHKKMDFFNFLFSSSIFISAVVVLIPIVLEMCSIYCYSSKFKCLTNILVHRIKSKHLRNVYRQNLNSFRILCCEVGNFYPMENRAQLTLLDTTLHGIVSTLVMLS